MFRLNLATSIVAVIFSQSAFSGVTKTICKSATSSARICLEDPNTQSYIPLKVDDLKVRLEGGDKADTYADSQNLFRLDVNTMELEDSRIHTKELLVCGDARPGTCVGWNF